MPGWSPLPALVMAAEAATCMLPLLSDRKSMEKVRAVFRIEEGSFSFCFLLLWHRHRDGKTTRNSEIALGKEVSIEELLLHSPGFLPRAKSCGDFGRDSIGVRRRHS
ncbi:unnamed protein product [Symbiodinium sp. CCMP2592]|nr:unnamed protein product [Symbiodinium sp. CCMP2592]